MYVEHDRQAEANRFGALIREGRERRGWSPRQLAERVSPGTAGLRHTLALIEVGQAPLPRELDEPLARALHLPLETVAAGTRLARNIAYLRFRASDSVDTSSAPWTDAPLLSRYAQLLVACRADIERVPEWADMVVPFAVFGRLQGPAEPARTLGQLIEGWSSGELLSFHPDCEGVPWMIVGRRGGYLNYRGYFGFLPGGPPSRTGGRDPRRVESPLWEPTGWPCSPQQVTVAVARVIATRDPRPWTLSRMLGPEGLGPAL